MGKEISNKMKQFLTYFGKSGKAPKLQDWNFKRKRRNDTFNSVTVVWYKVVDMYRATAEATYREGFYNGTISLSDGEFPSEEFESINTVDFEKFYRDFQKALMYVSNYMIGGEVDLSNYANYPKYAFSRMFGEEGEFIANSGWIKDDAIEQEDEPGLSAFFVYSPAGRGNYAYLLASTDFSSFELNLEVYKDSVMIRSDAKENIENIYNLEEEIINYMNIAEADFSGRSNA